MSISAISVVNAAIGGKTLPPGAEGASTESGFPTDFAAILAEQSPALIQTSLPYPSPQDISSGGALDSRLLSSSVTNKSAILDGELQENTIPANRSDAETNAEAVLAALTSPPDKAASTISETHRKEAADEDQATAAGTDPTTAGLASQYVLQLAAQTAQSRTPDNIDRSKSGTLAQNPDASAKDQHSALSEPANAATETASLAAAKQAGSFAESRIVSRSDTANAAILAGESSTGNSSNTPAFATALASANVTNAAAIPTNQRDAPTVTTALGAPNWQHDFGTHVVWLAKNNQQVAHININPPQLGPIQISISLNGDQASATFTSPHAEVRQAIQDSLPQLRDMFTTAGISLGQANVGTQLPSQHREMPYQFANTARSPGENAILSPDSHSSSNPAGITIQRGRGLVDLFA